MTSVLKEESFKPSPVFIVVGHILTIIIAAATGGVAYGALESRISSVEHRVTAVETNIIEEVRELKRDVNNMQVEVGKVARDIQWLKENKKTEKQK